MSLYIEIEKLNRTIGTEKQEKQLEKQEKQYIEKILFKKFDNAFNVDNPEATPETIKKSLERLTAIKNFYRELQLEKIEFHTYIDIYKKQLEKVYKLYNTSYKNDMTVDEQLNIETAKNFVKNSIIYNLQKINCFSNEIYLYKEFLIDTALDRYNVKNRKELERVFNETCKTQHLYYKHKEKIKMHDIEVKTTKAIYTILLIIFIGVYIIL